MKRGRQAPDNYTHRKRSGKKVDPFYRSPQWKQLRAWVLKRDGYLCADCGKDLSGGGAHVDHIVSRARRPDLELRPSNLETRCWSCHSRATATRDRGFGNRPVEPDRGACDAGGDPVWDGHPWNQGRPGRDD